MLIVYLIQILSSFDTPQQYDDSFQCPRLRSFYLMHFENVDNDLTHKGLKK